MVAALSDDEQALAHVLQVRIDGGLGPTTLAVSVDREMEALIDHPRLGPLVRQLSLYAQKPRFASGPSA